MSDIKQVIVIRKDLKMRRGKEIAQGSHASMSFMTSRVHAEFQKRGGHIANQDDVVDILFGVEPLTPIEIEWMCKGFTKVCLQVNSEAELDSIYLNAVLAGLQCHMIIDSGKTEFGGVPTKTCLAIGPDKVEHIDKITSNLSLY